MKLPRIPATFGVLVVVAGSFTASPTQARANEVALAFGVHCDPDHLHGNRPSIHRRPMGHGYEFALAVVFLGLREEHEGLGGNITWSSNHVWTEHEGTAGVTTRMTMTTTATTAVLCLSRRVDFFFFLLSQLLPAGDCAAGFRQA
jgi:hypothetical protein